MNSLLALPPVHHPLQQRNVAQHVLRIHPRIHPKILRQVPQRLAQLFLVPQNIQRAQENRPAVRVLQRRNRPHQRRLPRPVRPQQPIQPARNRQTHIVESAHAPLVNLGQTLDLEFHRLAASKNRIGIKEFTACAPASAGSETHVTLHTSPLWGRIRQQTEICSGFLQLTTEPNSNNLPLR